MANGIIELDSTKASLEGRINWSSSSLGSDRNASSVYAELQVRRNDGYTTTGTWTGFLEINDDQRNFSVRASVGSDWVTLISFSIEKAHNSDGTGSCDISGTGNGPSGTSMSGHSVSGSENVTLDTIPRYVTGTAMRMLSATLNTAEIKWYTDNVCSEIKYGLSPNNMVTAEVDTNSSTFDLRYLIPNTQYTVYFNAKRKDSGLYLPNNFTYQFTTPAAGTLSPIPDSNIGESQTISWINPTGAALSLTLRQLDDTLIQDFGTVTGTSTIVTPTASTLYALTPLSNTYTAKYVLKTTQGLYSYNNEQECNFIVVNQNPSFDDSQLPSVVVDYEDKNDSTYALTGLRTRLIKGYSTPRFTLYRDLFEAGEGANLTSGGANFTVLCGDKSYVLPYANASYVDISAITTRDGSVTVTDSRGNSFTRNWLTRIPSSDPNNEYAFYEYFPLSITSGEVHRTGGVSKETTLECNGQWWNNSFGATNNALDSVTYKFRESGTENYSSPISITPTTSGNTFSFSSTIIGDEGAEGFDVEKSYDIVIKVQDKLSFAEFQVLLISGVPALAIVNGNKIAQGAAYDPSLGGDFQMNGIVYLNGESLLSGNDIEDSLTSTDATKVLSAKQGKELKDITDDIRGRLLWSSTTTSRGADTLSLEDSNYDYAIIYCYRNGALDNRSMSYICEKGMEIEMTYIDYFNNAVRCWSRNISFSGSSATITTGIINGSANTGAICPYKIVGFKY